MHQYIKIALKTATVFGIFAIILFGNTLLQAHDIQVASNASPCHDIGKYNIACFGVNPKGVELEYRPRVGAFYMYISSGIFVFLSLLLFKPKQFIYIAPILTISWIELNEVIIRLLNIEVIHRTLFLGKIDTTYGLYFQTWHGIDIVITLIIVVIAAVIAYPFCKNLRKSFLKPHNNA